VRNAAAEIQAVFSVKKKKKKIMLPCFFWRFWSGSSFGAGKKMETPSWPVGASSDFADLICSIVL
jgi:hypothetical protein